MAKKGRSGDSEADMKRQQAAATAIIKKRDELRSKLAELDRDLRALGPAAKGRVRPRNDMNLVEALRKVLNGKTMGVTQVSEVVQKAGYKTFAANFRTIVNQTLIKNRKIFKKVSRGQYTAG